MSKLQELKDKIAAMYQKADEQKCYSLFEQAMDLENDYNMMVIDYKYGLPQD